MQGREDDARCLIGTDRSGFCEVLGQLLMSLGSPGSAPDFVALVLPKTPRVAGFAKRAVDNELLARIPVPVALARAEGDVEEVGSPWGPMHAPGSLRARKKKRIGLLPEQGRH